MLAAPLEDPDKETLVEFEAVLFDEEGGEIPDLYYEIQWSYDGPLSFVEQRKHSVVVKVDSYSLGEPATLTAALRAGGISPAQAELRFVEAPILGDGSLTDAVLAEHSDGSSPTVALVSGVRLEDNVESVVKDEVTPFVRVGILGSMIPSDGEIAAASSAYGATIKTPLVWKAATDKADLNPQPGVMRIPVKVWIALDDVDPDPMRGLPIDVLRDSAQQYANYELALANYIYKKNRTGISFAMVNDVPAIMEDVERSFKCDGDYERAPGVLNVYYVTQMGSAYGSGYHCPRDGSSADVVLIPWLHNATSLAHEFGHALSLLGYGDLRVGHVDDFAGFDHSNIMHGLETEELDPRGRISLGQVYRMSFDERSWLNLAVKGKTGADGLLTVDPHDGKLRDCANCTIKCQKEAETSDPCPMLKVDLIDRSKPEPE
jgi:hypothetical protein